MAQVRMYTHLRLPVIQRVKKSPTLEQRRYTRKKGNFPLSFRNIRRHASANSNTDAPIPRANSSFDIFCEWLDYASHPQRTKSNPAGTLAPAGCLADTKEPACHLWSNW